MAELDGIDDGLFFDFFCAGFNHHDPVGGSDDHDVHQALAHLVVGGIHDELAVDQAHANGANRPEEGNVGKRQRARGGVDAAHVWIIICVGRQHEGNDLRLAAESFRKQGPHGPVNLPAGQNFALARTPFALDKSAGNASTGIGVLAVIHREREEIDALARVGIGHGGSEHDVVVQADDGCSMRLLGQVFQFQMRFVFRRRGLR